MANISKSKYVKKIRGMEVDVYDVLQAWDVRNPSLQHLIKKALQAGNRGHKSKMEDLHDILEGAQRAIELQRDLDEAEKAKMEILEDLNDILEGPQEC